MKRLRFVLLLAVLAIVLYDGHWLDNLDYFRFARYDGRAVVEGSIRSPLAMAGVHVAGSAHGDDVLGVPAAVMPADARVQLMSFRFRSRGFFTAEPGAHLAIGLTGAWRKDDPATPARDGLLVGRGVVIGNVRDADDGCTQAPVVEIESFRRRGNRLFAGSCSPPLHDGVWYRVAVISGRDGSVGYRLADADDKPLAFHEVDDTGADIPGDLGGWWLLHVFSHDHPERDWVVDIADFHVEWLPQDGEP